MKRTRCPEEQAVGVLKDAEAGAKAGDLAWSHGVFKVTIDNCQSRDGLLEVSDARRLRELDNEIAKLKRLPRDTMLAHATESMRRLTFHERRLYQNVFASKIRDRTPKRPSWFQQKKRSHRAGT
jgi:putative transposase